MANYTVDIAIALQNSNKLIKLRKELKAATDNIREFNKEAREQNKVAVSTFSKLNKQLSRANSLLDKAAIGTSSFTRAAKALVNVERERNLQLKEREKLLDDLRGVTEKKASEDNKRLQDSLLKLERRSTKEQEKQFLLRQEGQDQLKQKVREINKQRKEENKLIKQNVNQTKKSVADEIKKKFSIIASGTERRKNLQKSVRELEANRKQIPINDRINAQLKKRGLILSSNGKKIISNNQARRAGVRGGRFQNALSSGLIGGGFPLLFGQGPTAAIGGALGGVAGGAFGGQFGFALSIAGTAIGSALDELTKALAKPTENIEILVTKLGLANTETGDLVLRMNELGMTSDASALLLNKFAEKFNLTKDQIKENTDKMNDFNNQINLLGTSLTLLLSDVLGPLITELNNLTQGKKPEGTSRNFTGIVDFFTANAFDFDKRGGIFDEFFDPTGNKFRNPFNRANDPLEFNTNPLNLNLDNFDLRGKKAQLRFEEKELLPLRQALELEQKRLTTSAEDLNILKEKFELENLNNELKFLESQKTDEVNQQLEDKIAKLKIVRDTQQQIFDNAKALADPFRQLSNIIAQDIGNGIKGLIQGTQTLNNVLSNVLNKLSNAFLNRALFGNIQGALKKEQGLIGNLFGGFLADGGFATAGKSFIVGEKGPELFTPKVSGQVTPNSALKGSTNVVVNVNVSSGTRSISGSGSEARQLGGQIAAVVQTEIRRQQRSGGLLA